MSKISNFLKSEPRKPGQPYEFDDDKPEVKQTKTAKINNEQSSVKNAPQIPSIKDRAHQLVNNETEQIKVAIELTKKLLSMINDKTLDENKDQRYRDGEKQILSEYINFARLINSDPNTDDNNGTLTLVNALGRCMLLQRDRINQLEYEVVRLRKSVDKPKTQENSK